MRTQKLLCLRIAVSLAGLLALMAFAQAADRTRDIDGVPLPLDATFLSPSESPFGGIWTGAWGGTWKTLLVVEKISEAGRARVIYALADNRRMNFKGSWFRYDAEIDGSTLRMTAGQKTLATFRRSPTGRLRAVFGKGRGFAVFTRQDAAAVLAGDVAPDWSAARSERVRTDLRENGSPVHLEVLLARPPGPGPFPLAVVNHGSTGAGVGRIPATRTWSDPWLADVLNARGWIVAFPQRRGRGRSDGLYDEGFAKNREQGYSCATKRALAGADRGLRDIRAAVVALRRRPEISARSVLMAGLSRGGALSIAYAGAHPSETAGAINFVGGWMGDQCRNAVAINRTLLKRGAAFRGPTLWLYGHDDPFYALSHSRGNFAAFTAAGGSGRFVETRVPGRQNGHWVLRYPHLWSDAADNYLDLIAKKTPN